MYRRDERDMVWCRREGRGGGRGHFSGMAGSACENSLSPLPTLPTPGSSPLQDRRLLSKGEGGEELIEGRGIRFLRDGREGGREGFRNAFRYVITAAAFFVVIVAFSLKLPLPLSVSMFCCF